MRRPGHNTALALRVCLSCGTENLSVSKNFASGQKRRRVPVLRWPTVPISSSFELTLPSLKPMLYSLPPRLIQHSRDRKSTLLNSSHVEISYAVFCLKKKKIMNTDRGYNRKVGDNIYVSSTICFV